MTLTVSSLPAQNHGNGDERRTLEVTELSESDTD